MKPPTDSASENCTRFRNILTDFSLQPHPKHLRRFFSRHLCSFDAKKTHDYTYTAALKASRLLIRKTAETYIHIYTPTTTYISLPPSYHTKSRGSQDTRARARQCQTAAAAASTTLFFSPQERKKKKRRGIYECLVTRGPRQRNARYFSDANFFP